MYDPRIGQFLSPDPIEDDPTNDYRYVRNNSINLTDPTGLNPNQQGALELDELISIVRTLEDGFKITTGRFPDYKETMKLLLNEQVKVDENGRANGIGADGLTNVNHYYIFMENGIDGRFWIDMRHFAETSSLDPPTAVVAGGAVETLQAAVRLLQDWKLTSRDTSRESTGSAASARGVEDQPSNLMGANFRTFYRLRSCDKVDLRIGIQNIGEQYERVSEYLEEYLRSIGATKLERSESLEFLPKGEKEWRKWNLDPENRKRFEVFEGAYILR